MKELLDLFLTSYSCNEQDEFLQCESFLITGNGRPEHLITKMREYLLKWCESQVNSQSFELSTLDGKVLITHADSGAELSYSWEDFPEVILDLIRYCKEKDEEAIKQKLIEELNK